MPFELTEQLSAILDTAVDGVIVIDAHGRIEVFNPAAERLFGYTAAEVIGRNVSILMPSPHRDEHDGYIARYLATGHGRIIGYGREVQGLRKDGSLFPLHLAVGRATIQGEVKFTGILHDLSSRVALEARLREQAALASLGEMAAVIAHEVKNPLAGIRGAIQVFGSRMAAGDANALIVKEIVSRIDSLDRMMKDLLLFARPPQPRLGRVEIKPLLTSLIGVLQEDPAMRGVDLHIHGDDATVAADADMLKTVFQNLLLNSGQAMGGRGRIDLAVTTTGATCEIACADQGPGIPADVRAKVFHPFFTTKSRGSGLGLATAKRLVEAHGGEILVESPAAGGTRVIVRLPIDPP